MERADVFIKTIGSILAGILSIFTGLFGVVFTILLGLMAVDFLTGLIAAYVTEGLKSSKGYKGLLKKVYTMLLIGSVLLIEIAVLKSKGVITDSISGAFCVIEFISIIENGNKMGLNLGFLNKLVSAVKTKTELGDDEQDNNRHLRK
ncbi:phage holin family protein [Paenibacillus sp. GCM10012307]|uniref:Phage holin family protein n=1 Tax=Paenibacillus roseus TaxID=2798579 RepID=A0A934J3K3_9BACL|nr:phage holin family protein [Paenibacillus roseus]MBJ6362175.1 phage holin family protein [Paenibacillus roseus]